MSFLGSSAAQVRADLEEAKKTAIKVSSSAKKAAANYADIKALGASDYSGISKAVDVYKNGGLDYALKDIAGAMPSKQIAHVGSSSGSASGVNYSGSNSAQGSTQQKSLEQIINETVDKNNAWAAEQAQKQMDFQKMMSDTAHQREVADLKAAGLNPILSVTGGNGAPMASGAMAQPDTSNTRLLAEMSLGAVDALTNSAVSLSNGYRSKASNTFANKLLNVAEKYVIPTLARGAASAISHGLFG